MKFRTPGLRCARRLDLDEVCLDFERDEIRINVDISALIGFEVVAMVADLHVESRLVKAALYTVLDPQTEGPVPRGRGHPPSLSRLSRRRLQG